MNNVLSTLSEKNSFNMDPSIITWQKSHKALGMNIEISIFVNKESGGVNVHISKKPLQRQEAIGDLSTEIEEISGTELLPRAGLKTTYS